MVCDADAKAATIPFLYRANVALPHHHDVDSVKIAAANKLDRVEKLIKVWASFPTACEYSH